MNNKDTNLSTVNFNAVTPITADNSWRTVHVTFCLLNRSTNKLYYMYEYNLRCLRSNMRQTPVVGTTRKMLQHKMKQQGRTFQHPAACVCFSCGFNCDSRCRSERHHQFGLSCRYILSLSHNKNPRNIIIESLSNFVLATKVFITLTSILSSQEQTALI